MTQETGTKWYPWYQVVGTQISTTMLHMDHLPDLWWHQEHLHHILTAVKGMEMLAAPWQDSTKTQRDKPRVRHMRHQGHTEQRHRTLLSTRTPSTPHTQINLNLKRQKMFCATTINAQNGTVWWHLLERTGPILGL